MKIAALDSSGLVASVAIYSDDILTAEYTVNFKKTHSQTLLPMLEELTKMTEMDIRDVDAIAVSAGPGSFTGLRIGSATAKGLALAIDRPIIEVPTLESMAMNLWGSSDFICPIMDARRNQVYTGIYSFNKESSELEVIHEACAISIEELIGILNNFESGVIFLGDGVPVYRNIIEEKMEADYRFAPAHLAYQSAGSLASLARLYYERGKITRAQDHVPIYLRLSQAEREMQEKMQKE